MKSRVEIEERISRLRAQIAMTDDELELAAAISLVLGLKWVLDES